jgi:hypothetical protein
MRDRGVITPLRIPVASSSTVRKTLSSPVATSMRYMRAILVWGGWRFFSDAKFVLGIAARFCM